MKKSHNPAVGKILNHAEGLGVTNDADIEQRADEVARIEGHRVVSDQDRYQAQLELNGEDVPQIGDDDEEGISSLSRDPSEPMSNLGRQIPNQENEDEEFATERLVAEGVNEADHDQMLAARKRKRE